MINPSAVLISMASLYLHNHTDNFIEGNGTSFYKIDKTDNDTFTPIIIEDSEVNVVYFPKCCPPEHVFVSGDRKCIESTNTTAIYDELGFNVTIIKSGLKNCQVIVDRRVAQFKLDQFSNDRSFILDDAKFSHGAYCLDKLLHSNDYIARLCHPKEYCTTRSSAQKDWCLKKCCRDGYVLSGRTCIFKPDLGLNIADDLDIIERNDSIALYTDDGQTCRGYKANKTRFNFTIKGDGRFLIYERQKSWKEYQVGDLMYCTETYYNSTTNESKNVFKLCAISTRNDMKFQFSKPAMIISCVCLAATIVIYVFIYKLKKIIERIIASYCFFLMMFYFLSILVHTISDFGAYCEFTGFTLYFSYIASFSWLNILCYDIYKTVGSMKTTWRNSKHTLLKKMAYYSTYAMTVPSIVTLLLYMGIKKIYYLPPSIYPYLIKEKCVISKRARGTYGHILYSVVPVGILITVNIVFFVRTLRYYLKAKNDLKKITTRVNKNKLEVNRKKIAMILKLSVVMGISWIFEIISLTVDFRQHTALEVVETIIDTFNYSQGVFVFLIFLVKWQTIENMSTKLDLKHIFSRKGKDYEVQPTAATNSLILSGSS